jgi:hypothetical protein
MRKGNFVIGQRVRLKWELDPPENIPAGAIGEVTRVSPWMRGCALKNVW